MADNINVKDSSTSADIPAATDDVGGVHYQKMKLDLGGDGVSVPVVGALPVTPQIDATATGTLAILNDAVTVAISGRSRVVVQVLLSTATGSPQVAWEASVDGGTTWIGLLGIQRSGNSTLSVNSTITVTTTNVYQIDVAGFTHFRARCAVAPSSGSLAVTIRAETVSGPVIVSVVQNSAANLSAQTSGPVAHDAVNSGSPIKIGGKANDGTPTSVSADNDIVDSWFRRSGAQVVTFPTEVATADGLASPTAPATLDYQLLYNGATWDMARNDIEVTALASASRSVTTQSADIIAHNHETLLIILNVSVVGTGSITPALQGKDPVSGNYFTIWTAEYPVIANGTFSYYFANGASGGEFTECLAFGLGPRVFRLQFTANNANAVTYSAAAVLGDN